MQHSYSMFSRVACNNRVVYSTAAPLWCETSALTHRKGLDIQLKRTSNFQHGYDTLPIDRTEKGTFRLDLERVAQLVWFCRVTTPVVIHEAVICAGNVNNSVTGSVHHWCIGCCAEAGGRREWGVGLRARTPPSQVPNSFIHSYIHLFIHGSGMSSHQQQARRF